MIHKYREMFDSTKNLGDILLLYLLDKGNPYTETEGVNIFTFNDEVLTALNYFPLGFTLVPGSNHFPLLKFYLFHPNYDYYWCIEEDVDFSGDWRSFF